MYIKVFAHGTGRGELATNYLVRTDYHNRDEKPPEVLRGDHELTAELINSIERKWKYTAGVLSWHPDDKVTAEKEIELINDFEKLAFAGLEPDQYNILWVRHTHANHHELHFVIPRMELSTGKAFNPCPPGWQKHFDPLQHFYNIKENWARPDDPERKRIFTPPQADIKYNRLKRWNVEITKNEADEIRELLIDYVVKQIENGIIENREDIIKSFQDLGLHINRKGKDYITIHDTESNKKIRLKGGIFNENWRIEPKSATEIASRPKNNGRSHARELEQLQSELEQIHEKRCEYNRKQYANHRKADKITHKSELESESIQLLHDNATFNGLDFGLGVSEQDNKLLHDKQNQHIANENRGAGARTFTTLGNRGKLGNMGNTNTRGRERAFLDSPQYSDSQHELESWRSRSNQTSEQIGATNERNTTISTEELREFRTELKQQNGYSKQRTQNPASPTKRIAETTKRLGTMLERLNHILQQITALLSKRIRKAEQELENQRNTKSEQAPHYPRLRM